MINNPWLRPLPVKDLEDYRSATYGEGALGEKLLNSLPVQAEGTQIVAILSAGDEEAAHAIDNYEAVRLAFYALRNHFPNLVLLDLGILQGDGRGAAEVLEDLRTRGIVTLFLTHNTVALLAAYGSFERSTLPLHIAFCGQQIDYWPESLAEQKQPMPLLNSILADPSTRPLRLSYLALQSFLTDRQTFDFWQNKNFEALRLGELREHLEIAEPLVRQADMLYFDLSALRQSEAPATQSPRPAGLFLEEACRIARYAGLSEQLNTFVLQGFNPFAAGQEQTAQAAAQILWYFLEGLSLRKTEDPEDPTHYTTFFVHRLAAASVVFRKHNFTDRWWFEGRDKWIPCAYEDYLLASGGDFPDRLLPYI